MILIAGCEGSDQTARGFRCPHMPEDIFVWRDPIDSKRNYSGDSVFHVHGNACKTLFNGLETQRFDHV